MDEFEDVLREAEREGIQASQGLARLLMDLWNASREEVRDALKEARKLRAAAIAAVILSAVCLALCLYLGSAVHTLRGELQAVQDILDAGVVIEEVVTTTEETVTTQTAEGDIATIHNGNAYYGGEG